MPASRPPADLIHIKVQYIAADAEYQRIRRSFPTGQQIAMLRRDGLNPIADQDAQRSQDAFQRCIDLGDLVQAHPWWWTQPSRADADQALTDAARRQVAASHTAAVA
jgi:hypothetical protein